MNSHQAMLFNVPRVKRNNQFVPQEYKVVCVRECPTPEEMQLIDTPERAADYWRVHIPTVPNYNPEVECFVVLLLNTRRRIKGHSLTAVGILDSVLVHPREVFRPAIIGAASGIIVMHNHPSGDPSPSDHDIKVSRELFRAGQLLKIELLDSIIVGMTKYASLRELGYLYN